MIAAVSNRGLTRFKLYEGALNGAIVIDFMTRLVWDAKQKVFLIVRDPLVDLASFDKNSGAVQEWLADHKYEIEIFTLPVDAPEHTPDEARQDPHDLVAATSSILRSIQRRPDRIKSYFHAKHPRTAA